MWNSFVKCSLASIPMGIVTWFVLKSAGEIISAMTLASSLLRVSTACAAGVCIYFSMCYMMKVDETHKLVQYVGKKLLIC
jgi:peptidoglycan biosynthesis protein MviN/MurJ (putative lipid II flippase)